MFTAKVDDKMQHRKVKSIAILVHSDETQFYICSADDKVRNAVFDKIWPVVKNNNNQYVIYF